jgi:hypothetical protein
MCETPTACKWPETASNVPPLVCLYVRQISPLRSNYTTCIWNTNRIRVARDSQQCAAVAMPVHASSILAICSSKSAAMRIWRDFMLRLSTLLCQVYDQMIPQVLVFEIPTTLRPLECAAVVIPVRAESIKFMIKWYLKYLSVHTGTVLIDDRSVWMKRRAKVFQ